MPTENTLADGAMPTNALEHNAEVAAKLSAQDISGHSMAPKDTGDAGDALDALAKAHDEEAKKKSEDAATPPEPKPSDEPDPAKVAEEKAAAEKLAAEHEVTKKRADELFKDSPGLPPNASPKSSESFNAIKIKAAQEVARYEAEVEKLRAEKTKLEEQTKNQAPPEALKELEEHRQWRAKLDVEADPKFKAFDKTVAETNEFIYSQLKRSPVVTDEVIEAIKKHGGPDKVDMARIFEAVKDPSMQRLIESKLADIEMTRYAKTKAIEETKKNLGEYLTEREKVATASATAHNSATEIQFKSLADKLDWYKEKTVDAKATPEERKAIEAHNAFVAETRGHLAAAVKDDSPEMRAIMLAGMAQLFYLQKVHGGVAAKLTAAEKAVVDITAKYDKLRNGSTTRLRENVELTGGKPPAPKPSDQFTKTAAEALDDIRKQVTDERERAEAAGGR